MSETPSSELGSIEQVSLRSVWQNEARDFTPWLANNLTLLGEALGMELEEVPQEAQVGSFSLDILAKEVGREVNVAIENQLEETDHTHLGQLLTYAAGYDARIVIWITPYFQNEHRAVIDWLNWWTPPEVEFYAVEVRTIKIGDSLVAPEFRAVAFPNEWARERQSASSGHTLLRRRQYRDFFQPLVRELRQLGFTSRIQRRYDRHYHHFLSDFEGIFYSVCFVGGSAFPYAYVHIQPRDQEAGKRIFDALKEKAAEIEVRIDGEWEWRRLDRREYSNVGLKADGSIDDPPERLSEIRAWMLAQLPKLKEVLDPHLSRVLKELHPRDSDGSAYR